MSNLRHLSFLVCILWALTPDLSAARGRAIVRNPFNAIVAVDAQIYDVAVDASGTPWFTTTSLSDGPFVGRLESDGSIRKFFRDPMIDPGRLACAPDGSVWFGEQFIGNPF